jgi:hypothetical protein
MLSTGRSPSGWRCLFARSKVISTVCAAGWLDVADRDDLGRSSGGTKPDNARGLLSETPRPKLLRVAEDDDDGVIDVDDDPGDENGPAPGDAEGEVIDGDDAAEPLGHTIDTNCGIRAHRR